MTTVERIWDYLSLILPVDQRVDIAESTRSVNEFVDATHRLVNSQLRQIHADAMHVQRLFRACDVRWSGVAVQLLFDGKVDDPPDINDTLTFDIYADPLRCHSLVAKMQRDYSFTFHNFRDGFDNHAESILAFPYLSEGNIDSITTLRKRCLTPGYVYIAVNIIGTIEANSRMPVISFETELAHNITIPLLAVSMPSAPDEEQEWHHSTADGTMVPPKHALRISDQNIVIHWPEAEDGSI
ncbi:hypothetical protein SISNIDRAFT_492072 [Sistotremastrum niveocremeum HHB9708]|uniref:Uncharacterized protein n=1 Tax=Sistotremastrum niveocremeum HHB9708 TaxID=1314777 RepID=A0A164M3E8_9AGAM|nr:hypothetical protein SISNIDRAFT_492072 [Sistotremastrum niveocremeum HHB9708]